ncbi:MAG: succinylglutamate desuccinylase/aspartoacylase family protein [Geminicoccaceae bacterium]
MRGRLRPILVLRIRCATSEPIIALAQHLAIAFGQRFVGVEIDDPLSARLCGRYRHVSRPSSGLDRGARPIAMLPGKRSSLRTSEHGRHRIDLPAPAPGTARHLVVQRFGAAGARPGAYLRAALHAFDELPGVLVLHHLARLLAEAEAAGRVLGEVVLVPLANPIGLAQRADPVASRPLRSQPHDQLQPRLAGLPAGPDQRLGDRLGSDAAANVALIRRELAAQAAPGPAGPRRRRRPAPDPLRPGARCRSRARPALRRRP